MTPRTMTLGPASCQITYPELGIQPDLERMLREVTHVHVPEDKRGKGHGTALLNYVTYTADKHGVALMLEVKSEGTMTDAQLEAFYARHGFERFQSEPCVLMARMPRQ